MVKYWPHLIHPKEVFSSNQGRAVARWSLPSTVQLKLNFGGASRGNPGPSGASFILRDDDGRLA